MKCTIATLAAIGLAVVLASCLSPELPFTVSILYTRTSAAGFVLVVESNRHIETYAWNFGGGDKSADPTPSHAYDQRGTHTINLNVIEQNGRRASTHIKITVGHDWHVPEDGSLQAVVDTAECGDTVFVVSGSYSATIDKDLDLRSLGGKLSSVLYQGADGSLSGFKIIGDGRNSGLVLRESSPSIEDCTFSGSRANYGGAVYSENSSSVFKRCVFSNASAEYSGGAIYAIGSHSFPSFYDCDFISNHAGDAGGAMIFRSLNSSLEPDALLPRIEGCRFVGNTARQNPAASLPVVGGAIHVGSGCRVIRWANEFSGNVPADVICEDLM